MESAVEVRVERARGCGYRKPGGLYLISGGLAADCGRLPLVVGACPCCGQGIKPSRGWSWINPSQLVQDMPTCSEPYCSACPMGGTIEKAGLLWVGEMYYPTWVDFAQEAATQGISRRIRSVPRGFVVGETWVLLGHRKAIRRADGDWDPGIMHAFRPTGVEYVVRGDETEDDLSALRERGITPVQVVPAESAYAESVD